MKNVAIRMILFLLSSIFFSLYSGAIFLEGANFLEKPIYPGAFIGLVIAFVLLLYSIFFYSINRIIKNFYNYKIVKFLTSIILAISIFYTILFGIALTNTIRYCNYSQKQLANYALAMDLFEKPTKRSAYSYIEAKEYCNVTIDFLNGNPKSIVYIGHHIDKDWDDTIEDYFKELCANNQIDFDKRCRKCECIGTKDAIDYILNDTCIQQSPTDNTPINLMIFIKEYKTYRCLLIEKYIAKHLKNKCTNFIFVPLETSWNVFCPKITEEAINIVNNFYLKGIF